MIFISLIFFFINFLGTIPYAARIVGVKTKMLALSFSLFNVIALISRTVNGFQMPYLAKYSEMNLLNNDSFSPVHVFRELLLVSTLGCIIGMLCIPTTQRLFTKGVLVYYKERSLGTVFVKGFTKTGFQAVKGSFKMPSFHSVKDLLRMKGQPVKLYVYHGIATAFVTVGVMSTIYAGVLKPEFRTTASSLSFIINGISVIIMFLFIDPPLSIMTEDTVQGKITEAFFRNCILWFIISRIAGTILAQCLLIPLAKLTVFFVLHL